MRGSLGGCVVNPHAQPRSGPRPIASSGYVTRPTPGAAVLQEARGIGDEFLQLEKYVNLNYMAFHKILKKHDKNLAHSPCRQFYIAHLHNQPWVQVSKHGVS